MIDNTYSRLENKPSFKEDKAKQSSIYSSYKRRKEVHVRACGIRTPNFAPCKECGIVVAFQRFENYTIENEFDILRAKVAIIKHWHVAWDVDRDGQPWHKHIHHDDYGEKDILSRMSYGVIQPEDVLEDV